MSYSSIYNIKGVLRPALQYLMGIQILNVYTHMRLDDARKELEKMRAVNQYNTPFVHLLTEKMRENMRKNKKIQKMKLILLGFKKHSQIQ